MDIGYLPHATESAVAISCILSINIKPCYSMQKCQNYESTQEQVAYNILQVLELEYVE